MEGGEWRGAMQRAEGRRGGGRRGGVLQGHGALGPACTCACMVHLGLHVHVHVRGGGSSSDLEQRPTREATDGSADRHLRTRLRDGNGCTRD